MRAFIEKNARIIVIITVCVAAIIIGAYVIMLSIKKDKNEEAGEELANQDDVSTQENDKDVSIFNDINSIGYFTADSKEFTVSFENTVLIAGDTLKATTNVSKDVTYSWYKNDEKLDNSTATYNLTESDYESIIKVEAKCDEGVASACVYFSNLPVVYLTTNDGSLVSSKEDYKGCQLSIQGNDMFSVDEALYIGAAEVKGRGNSTWNRPKKPYKIKLDSKSDLFNMGESKHWVLLANDIDHTQIRNELVSTVASGLGMEFAPDATNVILIMNGKYEGIYELGEQVRVGASRVEIFDWEKLAGDAAEAIAALKTDQYDEDGLKEYEKLIEDALTTDFSWISEPYTFSYEGTQYNISEYVELPDVTGGFLLEMDFYANDRAPLKTKYLQPIYYNTPENGASNTELTQYAKNYIQSFEYAIHSEDFTFNNTDTHYTSHAVTFDWEKGWYKLETEVNYSDDANDGKHYTQLFDMDSLLQNFLVCEYTMNWDSMKNSLFMYKDIDGLAKIGPVWDYDWAFGNRNMFSIETNITNEWHTTNKYFTNEQFYQSEQWNRLLAKDPYFLSRLYEMYKEARSGILEDVIKQDGILDQKTKYLTNAAIVNDDKWSSTYSSYGGELFTDAIKSLREFIDKRTAWLDEQFASLDELIKSLGTYEVSSLINVTATNSSATANVSDASIAKVEFQINGTTIKRVDVSNKTATISIDSAILTTDGHKNVIQVRALDASGNYLYIKDGAVTTSSRESVDVEVAGWGWGGPRKSETKSATILNSVLSNYVTF